jgi:hypothetical protein
VWLEGLGKLKKCIHLIGSRTRDIPACSIVPYPLHYCVPPIITASSFVISENTEHCCLGGRGGNYNRNLIKNVAGRSKLGYKHVHYALCYGVGTYPSETFLLAE